MCTQQAGVEIHEQYAWVVGVAVVAPLHGLEAHLLFIVLYAICYKGVEGIDSCILVLIALAPVGSGLVHLALRAIMRRVSAYSP